VSGFYMTQAGDSGTIGRWTASKECPFGGLMGKWEEGAEQDEDQRMWKERGCPTMDLPC
jgi:hypothetical protein